MSGTTPAPKDGRDFWAVVAPLVTFVGTGLGLLGFVVFFGGFVLWTRFDAAGLPADDAVAQVPRATLVTTGASFLVPAVIVVAFPVALAVITSDAFGGRWRSRVGGQDRVVTRMVARAGRSRWVRLLAGLGPIVAFDAFYIWQAATVASVLHTALLVLAVLTSVAIAVVVLRATDHFGWFALAVFFGLGIVVAFSTYARTYAAPKLAPAAIVAGQAPVEGLFVAEGSEAVYVGERPPDDRADPVLVRVPKDSISALAVGRLMAPENAYAQAGHMVDALCDREVILRVATDKAPAAIGPACDAELR